MKNLPNAVTKSKKGKASPKEATARRERNSRNSSTVTLAATSGATQPAAPAIVGIGASAGGLEAFKELLAHLPVDTGMAFVLVQHLDPLHDSALTQILARATTMPVREATHKLRIRPNSVYVIPPNANLGIGKGALTLQPRDVKPTPNRSIDVFFQALALDQHERAIGVILSGTATDGTIGLEAIKAEGGITLAQDDSARYDSMPRSAVAAGCVDFVLSPEKIAKELARIAAHPYLAHPSAKADSSHDQAGSAITLTDGDETSAQLGDGGTSGVASPNAVTEDYAARVSREESGLKTILHLLSNHSGVNFSFYKPTTMRRRIARRMVLSRQTTSENYAKLLRGNAAELETLYSDVLISVTSFFRNADSFDILTRKVFPKLLRQPGAEPLRTWVVGCSSGQEAYSMAMAFVESAEKASSQRKFQVFATDLNGALLDKARRGLYPRSVADEVSPERLQRFFVQDEGGYRVVKALREMVVFARQNLLIDPPFSRMDLISCRNVLIYIEPSMQTRVIPTFHYALKPEGYLFLGTSESVGEYTDLFEPVDKKHRIYSRRAVPTPSSHLTLKAKRVMAPTGDRKDRSLLGQGPTAETEAFRVEVSARREADRITVNQFAPPAVLISADFQVLQFRGTTGAWLEPPTGKATFDVLKMAREGLMLPLRSAINKAKKTSRPVRRENVRVRHEGGTRLANVEVIPLKNLTERCYLILFEAGAAGRATTSKESPPPPKARAASRGANRAATEESRRIAELEADFAETRDFLQSIQEQHEAANEELQASSEEVQSANEELQSLNEELETSKEEMESANEELTTVNEELASRNAELHQLNDDLINLQSSTSFAIVLLGRDLTIRRFSTQAEKHFGLVAADVGRPIKNVRHGLRLATAGDAGGSATTGGPADLEELAKDVLASKRDTESEVRDDAGCWFSLRVRPYFTVDNRADGAVLTLMNIDALKRSEEAITTARDYAEAIVETVRDPLVILDSELRVHTASRAFYHDFGGSPADSEGVFFGDLTHGRWNIPELLGKLEDILPKQRAFSNLEMTLYVEQRGTRTLLLRGRSLAETGLRARILLTLEDITERRHTEDELRFVEERLRFVMDSMPQKIVTAAPNGHLDYFNSQWTEFTGLSVQQIERLGWRAFVHPDDVDETLLRWKQSVDTGELFQLEHRLRRADGEYRWHSSRILPMRAGDGPVVLWIGSNTDFDDYKQAASTSRKLADDLGASDRRKDEFLALLAHELRNPLAPIRNGLHVLRLTGGSSEIVLMMERQVGQLVRLVDDLLDVSRISHGKIELRKTRIELAAVVRHAVESIRPLADLLGHELTVTLPAAPIFVPGDSARLIQALENLLNNACKFTEPGGHVWLTIERAGDHAVVSVRDSGVGIAADDQSRIFDMFVQVDRSLERVVSGLGIGLTLVKNLVEMHDGSVEVHSAGVGQGSLFVVRVPADAGTNPWESPVLLSAPATSTSRRILVVDDNHDSATSLAMQLELSGFEARAAFDGLEAVTAAASFRPDLILLDIGLPTINGYEACRRIREQPGGTSILIVALTGWDREEDRQNARDAGFDDHLVKPVEHTALMKLLEGLEARDPRG